MCYVHISPSLDDSLYNKFYSHLFSPSTNIILLCMYIFSDLSNPLSLLVPSIDFLRAAALPNDSILVEWGLEYSGGYSVSLFEVHVRLNLPRSRRATPPPDLVYHVDVGIGRLVTRTVDAGHTYTVRATATNHLGPSDDQLEDGE